MENEFSSICCVADMNITGALDKCLLDLALPEVYIQRAKQISLADRQGFLGLRPVTKLEETRALLYRIYIPAEYEEGVIARIAEATDLRMGGRGGIFSHHIKLYRGTPPEFDTEKLDKLCGRQKRPTYEEHALISCTVSRGLGNALAEAVLELGACVPVIFFGTGVGLRDRLGLMRITIPVEKEIIWFIVPRSDADLVEKILIPRGRLDVPGQGFLYMIPVHAPVVNLRVRHGKRFHAATMEQVIAALDEVRGSSDWRRLGSRKAKLGNVESGVRTRGLFFIGEEEEVEFFRRTAMDCGARGATLNSVDMRFYTAHTQGQAMESHSRELCDTITSPEVEEKLLERIAKTGLFDSGRSCVMKTFNVEMPRAFRRIKPDV
jgi:hypothetical protein